MKTKYHSYSIQEGEWSFRQESDGRWRWGVISKKRKIISPLSFQKRVDMVEDARQHGYGHTSVITGGRSLKTCVNHLGKPVACQRVSWN